MWSNALWHTSHGHGHGSNLAMLTAFWPKMEYFEQKLNNLVLKMGQKGQKPYQKSLMATMVAMAAARRVKTALILENVFEILTPLGHEITFFIGIIRLLAYFFL